MDTLAPVRFFAHITKVDPDKRIVGGIASDDQLDSQGDIVDWEATKKAVDEYAKWRNIREMHTNSAVGRATTVQLNDEMRQLYIEAKIVDDDAWKKIQEQVYQGFSIGGDVLDSTIEADGTRRITGYNLNEISVVDRPANPRAVYTVVKRLNPNVDYTYQAPDEIGGASVKKRDEVSAGGAETVEGSFEDQISDIDQALNDAFGVADPWDGKWFRGWIMATFPDHVIVSCYQQSGPMEEGYYKIPYTIEDDEVKLGDPVAMEQAYLPAEAQKALKDRLGKAADDGKSEKDKLHEAAEARAKKWGIAFKDGKGHLTPPKGKPTDESEYADPVNYAYPIDEAHIRAAVGYFNHEGMREKGGYSEEEWAIIGKRIAEAANKLIGPGHEFKDGKIETDDSSESKEAGTGMKDPKDGQAIGKAAEASDGAKETLAAAVGDKDWESVDVDTAKEAVERLKEALKLAESFLQRETEERDADKSAKGDRMSEDEPDDKTAGDGSDDEPDDDGDDGDDGDEPEDKTTEKGAPAGAIQKRGARISKDTRDHLHSSRDHLLKACGCDECQDMLGGREPDVTGAPEIADTSNLANAARTRSLAKAVTDVVTSQGLAKAADVSGLREDLAKAADSIGRLESKVDEIANAPQPGGPVLRGGAPVHKGFFGEAGTPGYGDMQTAVLEKMQADPSTPALVKDHIGQILAKRLMGGK